MVDTIRPFSRPREGGQPPYLHPDYGSTVKRAPKHPPIRLEHTLTEVTGPMFSDGWAGSDFADLTQAHAGPPLGERIIVAGRVLDEDARPVPGTLVELWQCNAAGRYRHPVDQHDAPLDPNFDGVGQVLTNERGRIPLSDDQTRSLSVAQHGEFVAPRTHPFRRLRPGLCHPADHANVFSGRPAAGV